MRLLQTSPTAGLSEVSAGERLSLYGPNRLPRARPRSGFRILIEQVTSLPVALLGVAAGVSLLTGGWIDALVIGGVVVINAVIGYITESQSERSIRSLTQLFRPSVLVRRDGRLRTLPADEVVPGDLLVLRPGDYVAADARLIEAQHLRTDESSLTGETLPTPKATAVLADEQMPLGDRGNLVYMGTFVAGGQGLAVVVATGAHTEMGRIHTLVDTARPPQTPMERQLSQLGRQLAWISSGVCGAVFGIGLLQGYGLLPMLTTSIALAVAAVPEGLPTVATTVLALGIHTLRRRHVLARHLNAIETLGAVQTICLDKTGTLTLNTMSVVAVATLGCRIDVKDGCFQTADGPLNPFVSADLLRMLHVSVLCSETEMVKHDGGYALRGSSTENALVQMALTAGVDVMQVRARYPLVSMALRAENHNSMHTVHSTPDHQRLVAVKGSPNEVLSMCDQVFHQGQRVPLSDADQAAIEVENERMAGEALRVLGMAYGERQPEDLSTPTQGLVWLGLVGMADPIRAGVEHVIEGFHQAGIDTIMITGDQSPTAYAVSKQLRLSREEQLEILDSTQLTHLDPDVLTALASRIQVFARVSPSHKLDIVQALQRGGKVVAMTGDGINDGPALRAADIGIAMGDGGTDIAREVADVVLEDDNLETMLIAISQGRTIYNNIRKAVHFLLSTNLSEIMVMFSAMSLGLGQPLNAMQLLWINLLSDIAPGLALALEPPEPEVLRQPPRNPAEPIMSTADLKRIAFESAVLSAGTLGAYGYGLARYGRGARANTLAFVGLTLGQLLHALSCRSPTHTLFDATPRPPNPWLTAALGGSVALQGLAMFLPGLRRLLGLVPLTLLDGAVVALGALLPLLVNEGTKPRAFSIETYNPLGDETHARRAT
jgi:Ca2+-transporting ATPase